MTVRNARCNDEHILCSITFIFENRAVYEMWKNIVEPDTPQTHALTCWITKDARAHTHTKYAILIAFPRQQWLPERVSMLRYTYTARLANAFETFRSNG